MENLRSLLHYASLQKIKDKSRILLVSPTKEPANSGRELDKSIHRSWRRLELQETAAHKPSADSPSTCAASSDVRRAPKEDEEDDDEAHADAAVLAQLDADAAELKLASAANEPRRRI